MKLYHKAKGGDLRQWQVWTEGPYIVTEYGQVGGKLQQSRKLAVGKNLGKANETSPEEQAKLEAASLQKYKLDRKYSLTPEAAQEPLALPMLAHSFDGSKKKNFKFPADVQPKLDGVRCLASRDANGEIVLTSRQGKEWNIPFIAAQLGRWLPDDMTLDGEIYIHGESCQYITSLAKSADPHGKSFKPECGALEYHVYDVPIVDGCEILTWEERAATLYDIVQKKHGTVVPLEKVRHEKDLWEAHGQFIVDGYEGAILRAHKGLYLWGYRSSELLKVKEFKDAEFLVLDAREGRGKMEGAVIWTCQAGNSTFECTMKTSMNERYRMFEERNKYIGRLLTVRYFDLTDDNIPRFPVGIVFRDDKDI